MGTLAFEARTYRNGSIYGGAGGAADYGGSESVRRTGGDGSANFVMEIRIKLPVAVTSFTINLVPKTANSTYDFYYSLQTAQNSSYYDASGTSVTKDGSFKFSSVQGTTRSLTFSGSRAAGTYYVYVWSSKNKGYATHSQILVADSSVDYTAGTFTVTFNANGGGTPSPTSKTVTAGSTYGTLATVSRTGYTFAGWYTTATGGTKITSTTTVSLTANQTLYAHWTALTYTVNFNSNGGGTPSPTSKTVTYDSTYGTLATVSRSGYEFLGWFTAASGGAQITSSSTVSITAAQTLYAQWKALSILRAKHNGQWKTATEIYVKQNGTWQPAVGVHTKTNGQWKQSI